MVDGININGSLLPATVEARDNVPRKALSSKGERPAYYNKGADPISGNENKNAISSVIGKAAERRFAALSAGNVANFLEAAERLIDASLPSKPPGTRLRIDLDDASGRFIYQGVDKNTGDVVTQWPAEDILKFVAFTREREGLEGIVLDEEI